MPMRSRVENRAGWTASVPKRTGAARACRLMVAVTALAAAGLFAPAASAQQMPSRGVDAGRRLLAAAPSTPRLLIALAEKQRRANRRRIAALNDERWTLIDEPPEPAAAAIPGGGPPSPAIRRRIDAIERQLDALERQQLALLRAIASAGALPVEPAALAVDELQRQQEALVYLGFYDGRIDGQIGRRTRAAVARFQETLGETPTGTFTDAQQRRLRRQALALRRAHGVRAVRADDDSYGFVYPSRLMPREERRGETYRRFVTAADEASLQVVEGESGGMEAIFAGLLGRYVVDYSRLHADWFVVAGSVRGRMFMTSPASSAAGWCICACPTRSRNGPYGTR